MFGQLCMLFGWCAGIAVVDIYFFINFVNNKQSPIWWAIAVTAVLSAMLLFSGLHFFFTFVEWIEIVHSNFA